MKTDPFDIALAIVTLVLLGVTFVVIVAVAL